jgi:hypothetical protein
MSDAALSASGGNARQTTDFAKFGMSGQHKSPQSQQQGVPHSDFHIGCWAASVAGYKFFMKNFRVADGSP